jgi:PS-10 peptidase S37
MKLRVLAAMAVLVACGGDGSSATPDAAVDAAEPDAAVSGACTPMWQAPAGCTATDVVGKLGCIPGLTFQERPDQPLPGYVRYDLTFAQPIDHERPELGTFPQRAMLMLAAVDRPMVLATSGYNLSTRSRVDELAATFGANELWYEHRFFVGSIPAAPADWSKLDIRQAAADAHRLAAALHWMFPGRWVSTGVSKGGMTSVYHRRFYPCDVDATVAYVAPISLAAGDPTYNDFLSGVGGAAYATCRTELRAFQRRLLQRRAEIVPLVTGTFSQLPVAQAYEMAVIELAFAMWQYTIPDDPVHGCAAIPPATASPSEMLAFLSYHSSPATLAGDASLSLYRPYYHQAAGQLGCPAPFEAGLEDLLQYPGTDVAATFLPPGTAPAFDATAMPDVRDWVATTGARMMFVYGEFDPWSTRMYEPVAANDSVRYVDPAGNHGAKLRTLEPGDQAAAMAKLQGWLSTPALAQPALMRRPDDIEIERPRL